MSESKSRFISIEELMKRLDIGKTIGVPFAKSILIPEAKKAASSFFLDIISFTKIIGVQKSNSKQLYHKKLCSLAAKNVCLLTLQDFYAVKANFSRLEIGNISYNILIFKKSRHKFKILQDLKLNLQRYFSITSVFIIKKTVQTPQTTLQNRHETALDYQKTSLFCSDVFAF